MEHPNDSNNDVDIMLSLYENLDTLDNLLNCSEDRDSIINYEKLFLTQPMVFENNIERYLTHIANNPETKLWEYLHETLTTDECSQFINQFLNYLPKSKKDIQQLVNIFTKLITQSISDLINMCNYRDDEYIDAKLIFNTLMTNISVDNWSGEVTVIYLFLETSNLLDKFIKWAIKIENDYRVKINIEMMLHSNASLPDIYITNIAGVLLNAWSFTEYTNTWPSNIEVNEDNKNINKNININTNTNNIINPLYIMNKSCNIKWYDKKYKWKQFNTITNLFFSILNVMRVGIVPIFTRYKIYKKKLGNPLDMQMMFMKDQLTKYYNETKQVVELDGLHDLINNFYLTTYSILKAMRLEYDMIIDDMFNDMTFYIMFYTFLPNGDSNIVSSNNVYINEEFCKFLIDITLSKKYTNNISIKYDFVLIIKELILKAQFRKSLIESYVESLVNLYNEIQQTNIPIQEQFVIAKIITSFKTVDQLIVNALLKNVNGVKKMLYNMLNNLNTVHELIDKLYKELDRYSHILSTNTNATTRMNRVIVSYEEDIFSGMCLYTKILSNMKKFIVLFNNDKQLVDVLICDEILSSFATFMNQSVNRLASIKYKDSMNFKHFKNIHLDVESYVANIMTILTVVNKYSDMKEFTCNHVFCIENYDKLQKYVKNVQYNDIFEKLHNDLDEEENIDYPDEFLDPITYTKIKEPCLIPGMSGFEDLHFDKTTILKQLLVKNENPYTRAPLTQEDFETYNNLEEIQLKNKLFKERIMNYKI